MTSRPAPIVDPPVDDAIEHIERQRPAAKHDVMKVTNVESRAERVLSAGSQFENPQLPYFVRQVSVAGGMEAIYIYKGDCKKWRA